MFINFIYTKNLRLDMRDLVILNNLPYPDININLVQVFNVVCILLLAA